MDNWDKMRIKNSMQLRNIRRSFPIILALAAFSSSCSHNKEICHKLNLGTSRIEWGASQNEVKRIAKTCPQLFTDVLYPTLVYKTSFAGLECTTPYIFLQNDKLARIEMHCPLSGSDPQLNQEHFIKASEILDSNYVFSENERTQLMGSNQNKKPYTKKKYPLENAFKYLWENEIEIVWLTMRPGTEGNNGYISVAFYSKLYEQQLQEMIDQIRH